jgi:hypothetical protein
MLKSAILCLLIGVVAVEGFVRIKTTLQQEPSRLRQRLSSSKSVNQTLIGSKGNTYYTGVIHIGTPPRQYVVDFDTGSDVLWIVGVGCKYEKGGDCKAQVNKYDVKKSSTGKDLHKDFDIGYGTGAVKGNFVSDIVGLTLDLTGLETKNSFRFAYATNLSQHFVGRKFDGLFGLSFSEPDTQGQSYIEYLRDNKVFDPPIFTIWLERNPSGKPLGGEIIFGGRDPAHCGADLVTVKTIEKPWWKFNIEKVLLNGKKISGANTAITDTGATDISMPSAVYAKIAAKYPLGKVVDCNKYKGIEVTIQIGGKPFKLTANDLLISLGGKKCKFAIAKSDEWNLGDPFIKGYCQIHDYVKETLTLAASKHPKK